MWWVLLSCTGGMDSGVPDTGEPDSPVDTGFRLGGLASPPEWESQDPGVGTGLGWADLDQDGAADLVVAYGNDVQQGPLVVYANREGVLESEPSWRSDSVGFHGHLSVGDVNGDGFPDVAVSRFLGNAGFSTPGGVDVYLNRGGELESTPTWQSAQDFYTFSCALGDVDRDGDLDLAVAVGETYHHADEPAPVVVYENDGAGGFGEQPVWESGLAGHAFDVAWADMDADGWLDLLVANSGSGHAIYGNEAGVLGPSPRWQAPEGTYEGNTLDWGDVNHDGDLDLLVSDNSQMGGPGTVRLWCGPDFHLCWEAGEFVEYASAVSLEDVDGDGLLDVVAGAWWGAVRVFFNQEPFPAGTSGWISDENAVVEAFGWEDVDGSHHSVETVTGTHLLAVPGRGRVLEVTGGVAAGGWATGTGALEVRYLAAIERDLAVSNWELGSGNRIYGRR